MSDESNCARVREILESIDTGWVYEALTGNTPEKVRAILAMIPGANERPEALTVQLDTRKVDIVNGKVGE